MKKIKVSLIFLLLVGLFLELLTQSLSNKSLAKIRVKEKETAIPMCSAVGEIYCPKGFKPSCPKQHKPACVFVGNKQHPACLQDSADNTFFSYNLDKIACEKK